MKAYKVLAKDIFGSEYSEFVFAENEESAKRDFNQRTGYDLDIISVQYMYEKSFK